MEDERFVDRESGRVGNTALSTVGMHKQQKGKIMLRENENTAADNTYDPSRRGFLGRLVTGPTLAGLAGAGLLGTLQSKQQLHPVGRLRASRVLRFAVLIECCRQS